MAKNEVAKSNLPATMTEEFEGPTGLEGMGADEIRIPFLRVLDPKSPQCKPVERGGIEGAIAGSIYNIGTKEVYDGKQGFDFVPVKRDHYFAKYMPRNEDGTGGGFLGTIAADDPMIAKLRKEQGKFGKLRFTEHGEDGKEEPRELAETYSLYGVARFPSGQVIWVVIGFASTQIKHYTAMMSRVNTFTYMQKSSGRTVVAPLWTHLWHFKSAYEERGQQGWYGWNIDLAHKRPVDATEPEYKYNYLPPDDALRMAADDLRGMIERGVAKAEAPEQETDEEKVPF